MEVHHHSHTPKKIKEYISEFVMLFAAVTLGFFAENLREHKVTEHKIVENYQSLIEDLKQDSIKINSIFDSTEKYELNIVKFKYMLFQYHQKQIGWDSLRNNFNRMGQIPTYNTLFINNTSFKNMQSSGLLSYVDDRDLKAKMSYYYEVMFKQLEDNNKIFDQSGIDFFENKIPHRNSVEMRMGKLELVDGYPEVFSNRQSYRTYILNLPSTKIKLTSDYLVSDLDAYSGRYYFYNGLLHYIYDRNQELLKLLRNIEK